MMVPTANTERYSFLLETNLGAGRPTFLAGSSGAGKTVLAAQVKRRCAKLHELLRPTDDLDAVT